MRIEVYCFQISQNLFQLMTEPSTMSFYEQVYEVVRLIPYGRVTTYGAIARYLGTGKSSRLVGWAMNQSHFILPPVPAHRVVNRLGMLSGKAHFPPDHPMELQLEREGIRVIEDKVVHFEQLFWDPAKMLHL
jgi:methylated-DNA-protein-cysteine methyltransferase-like protein